ncbi:hypothetical protein HanRHA438_Chr02g0082181 [Helianthus annuus]|uniref:Uncharacterized protein n=1 Tax=Helianthus annuus TaxID=4232 RepID=A0A251VGA7_HELAN|nr:hypothetical protein HanXRQr2_Chr02g0070561 [Helianthus annuus]KAJ0940333.1 hypothetical protein HanRHA438_Chr02g0082181 [Helianthus annuus]KAJ0952126.1 hypothetical protein HanPSC8_Chr02g0068471 [Helianthus annuus]
MTSVPFVPHCRTTAILATHLPDLSLHHHMSPLPCFTTVTTTVARTHNYWRHPQFLSLADHVNHLPGTNLLVRSLVGEGLHTFEDDMFLFAFLG